MVWTSGSLTRKVLTPAVTLILAITLPGGWAFSAYIGKRIRGAAQRETEAALQTQDLVLTAVDSALAADEYGHEGPAPCHGGLIPDLTPRKD
nr:hypothetical protein [uncultured Holophaga sp.]